MSLYTQNKNVICGLGMTYAPLEHQFIWGNFFKQLCNLFEDRFYIIQEPKTETQQGKNRKKYRLPDICILTEIQPKLKPCVFIEISNNKNLSKAQDQQTEIFIKHPNAEYFIYNYDLNKWYKKTPYNYEQNAFCNVLNYDLNNLYLNSKYKGYIDSNVKEYKENRQTDKDNLAGLF